MPTHEAATFAGMINDTVEHLLSECDRRPSVLGIECHSHILGQPHRATHLERFLTRLREEADQRIWWTTAGAIAKHVVEGHATSTQLRDLAAPTQYQSLR